MKVFSLEKFEASRLDESIKADALKSGWPQKQDGKPEKECGPWSPSWEVEQEEWEVSKMTNMKFDKTKILTVVTADQAKVGQKGWFAGSPKYIQEVMSCGREPSVLGNIDLDSPSPFTREGGYAWPLFYPAPEHSHAERQAEWVKENGVKKGTRIRITKDYGKDSDAYTIGYIGVAGRCGTVSDVGDSHINVYLDCEEGYFITVPYYAMEVIKEPTYRPYNNDELNDLVGEILTNKKSGRRKLVTGKPTASQGINLDGSYITAKDLLSSFYRNTNETCGIKE